MLMLVDKSQSLYFWIILIKNADEWWLVVLVLVCMFVQDGK